MESIRKLTRLTRVASLTRCVRLWITAGQRKKQEQHVEVEVEVEDVKEERVHDNNALTDQDILEHCRSQLTAYKVPKTIEFVDDLPRSNVGKVLRRQLK